MHSENFAGIAKFSLMVAKFSQSLRNFHNALRKSCCATCCLLHCLCIVHLLIHHFHLTFLHFEVMKSPRILAFSTDTKPSLMTEDPKTCKTYQRQPRNQFSSTKWTCTFQLAQLIGLVRKKHSKPILNRVQNSTFLALITYWHMPKSESGS